MEDVIKLKFTAELRESGEWQAVHEKFIEACTQLDASILEPYIHEDAIFEDLDKYRFLQSLKYNFDKQKRIGIRKTTLRYGKCIGCQRGHLTHEFHSGDHYCFSYIVMKDDLGRVTDLFQCIMTSGIDPFTPFGDRPKKNHALSKEEAYEKLLEKNENLNTLKNLFDLE